MNLRSTTGKNHHDSTNNLTPPPSNTPLSPNSKSSSAGRVFTEEDEIKLLKFFKRSIRNDPSLTPSSLSFGKYSQPQIRSKIKRLKEKYHKMAKTKSKIKTPQDRKIYLLGSRIWGKSNGKASGNDENGNNFKIQDEEASKHVVFEDGLGFDNEDTENSPGANGEGGKADVDLEKVEKGTKTSEVSKNGDNGKNFDTQDVGASEDVIVEEGLDFNNENGENVQGINGDDLTSGKTEVNLENFPFLMENVSEEVKKIGVLYFEGLKSLGEEKLKELDDKWMVLTMQKAEIETERSLLSQKQFILMAAARRRM